MGHKGYVHSIEPMGAFDGPGLRWVVFMQGCLMNCVYCHNPDTWTRRHKGVNTVLYTDEATEMIRRNEPYYLASGGGITASGGEPLLQPDFIEELFGRVKRELSLTTVLDTAGVVDYPIEQASCVLQNTDLVMLDIKSPNPLQHKRLTGHPPDMTLAFLELTSSYGVEVLLRHVLVPGYTDDEHDLQMLAAIAKQHKNVKQIEILPYHSMGQSKWEALGRTYRLSDVKPPTESEIARAIRITAIDNR